MHPRTLREISIRVYSQTRVGNLFYKKCRSSRCSCQRSYIRFTIMVAQRWRIWEGFTEINTTSVQSAGEDTPVVFADFLDGGFVLSDLTPVYATDGSLSIIFECSLQGKCRLDSYILDWRYRSSSFYVYPFVTVCVGNYRLLCFLV